MGNNNHTSRPPRRRSRLAAMIAGSAATLVVLAGAGLASAHLNDGGDPASVHACVNNRDGTTRVVGPTGTCTTREQPLHWNVQGPKGDQGAPGTAGPPGANGAARVVVTPFDPDSYVDTTADGQWHVVESIQLPAGDWLIEADAQIHTAAATTCMLSQTGSPDRLAVVQIGARLSPNYSPTQDVQLNTPLSLRGTLAADAPTVVDLSCASFWSAEGTPVPAQVRMGRITALEVAEITVSP